jgi:cytochrome o ubiquinol oxidase subunit 2
MRFKVHALPPQQFAAWAASAHSGPALDAATYDQLQKPSSYVKPFTYGSVSPDLFDAIVANRAPLPISPRTTPAAQHVTPQPPLGHASNVR